MVQKISFCFVLDVPVEYTPEQDDNTSVLSFNLFIYLFIFWWGGGGGDTTMG